MRNIHVKRLIHYDIFCRDHPQMQILPKKSFVYNLQRLTLFLQSWHLLTPDFEFKEKLEDDLSLVISEAEIRGMKKDEFMKICENIFDSMKKLKPQND